MNEFRTLIYFHAGAGHWELNPLSVKGLNYLQPMFPSCKNDTFNPFVHNVEKWPHIISKFDAKFFLRCSQCKIWKYVRPFFNIIHEKVKSFVLPWFCKLIDWQFLYDWNVGAKCTKLKNCKYMATLQNKYTKSVCWVDYNKYKSAPLISFWYVNLLSADPRKWSNKLRQYVGFCRRTVWVCLTIL